MIFTLDITEIPYRSPIDVFSSLIDLRLPIFLDSSLHSEYGKYSYIAVDPFMVIQSKNDQYRINDQEYIGNPWDAIEENYLKYNLPKIEHLPPFQGGIAGYFGYESAQHLEKLPDPKQTSLDYPDIALGFYDLVISFDHIEKRSWICSSGFPQSNQQQRRNYAIDRRQSIEKRINLKANKKKSFTQPTFTLKSNFTKKEYQKSVAKVIDYIYEGDIFQANISQTFSTKISPETDLFSMYNHLRNTSPAPFSAFLRLGKTFILSSSPERFISICDNFVQTRPIKGTRPRGKTKALDEKIKIELLNSEKDRAENIMIVDLMRNDLSRVCKPHTVLTPEICIVESYENVHHLVSTINGELKDGLNPIDLLRATFPGGSITGAPKIRAMEVIHELEPTPRGPYCGSIGFIAFNGDMDTNILIRTITASDKEIQFQVGGGIISDSDPLLELQETLDKGSLLAKVISGNTL